MYAVDEDLQATDDEESFHGMGTLVVLALASIIFLSVILITAALMLRSHWDEIGQTKQPPTE
jgi:hypothetical protein